MFRTSILSLSVAGVASLPIVAQAQSMGKIAGNEFNPAISLILDGRYTDIDNSELELPGFQLGGEAGLPEKGFATGHNELVLSANIDDKFYGQMTAPIVYEDGETTVELEEAFIETLGLGQGVMIRGGKFYSGSAISMPSTTMRTTLPIDRWSMMPCWVGI